MPDHTRTAGDTAKDLVVTLTGADGTAQDLSGASVQFRAMRRNTRANAKDVAATVTDAAAGEVTVSGDDLSDLAAGSYDYQLVVTFADESTASFPDDGYDAMEVVAAVPAGS